MALTSPNAAPMADEAKNMRQKRPTAVKKAAAPLVFAMAGLASSITDLRSEHPFRPEVRQRAAYTHT